MEFPTKSTILWKTLPFVAIISLSFQQNPWFYWKLNVIDWNGRGWTPKFEMAGLGGIRPCRFKFTGPRPPPFQLITLDFEQNRRSPMYLMSFTSFPRGVWGMNPRGWGTSTSGCRHHGLLLKTDRKVCNKNVNYVYFSSCVASEIIDFITQAVQFHVFDTPPCPFQSAVECLYISCLAALVAEV